MATFKTRPREKEEKKKGNWPRLQAVKTKQQKEKLLRPQSPEETRSGRVHDLKQMETVDYVGVDQTRYGFILKEKQNAGRGESKVKPRKRKKLEAKLIQRF